MSSPTTSLSLLDRAGRGRDADAWLRLTQIYRPLLEAWLRKFGIQPADTEDLAQEILLAISQNLPKFEHSGRLGAFRSWLRRILIHRVRHHWRSQKYRAAAPGGSDWTHQLMHLVDDQSDASQAWNVEHDREVLQRLLEQIRPRFADKTWQAFRRQVLEGQGAAEVATALEMPVGSVYVARSRILHALRTEAKGLVDE